MQRFIVERISDGAFLELELPVEVSSASRVLSGAGSFSGTVGVDGGGLRMASGELLADQRKSLIHEEVDGVIRNSWVVSRVAFSDVWQIEGKGFSSFLDGYPYEGEYRGIGVDMADVVRHLWAYAQRLPGSNLGVTVKGMTGVKRGTGSDVKVGAALTASKVAKQELEAAKATLKAKRATAKASPTTGNKNAVTAAEGVVDAKDAAKKKADDALAAAKEVQSADGGAWKILWWDTPDCGSEAREAIEEAGWEFVEWSGWNADRSKILKEIRLQRRVGRQQNNLKFVEGANIIEAVVVESDDSAFANTIVAIGAGEGKQSLRVTVGVSDGRVRTPRVLDAKDVTKKSVLEKLARAELARRSVPLTVAAVKVDAEHKNAMRGTFGVGDTILVDCDVSWLGRKQLWHRIVEVEWVDESTADLFLEVA